MPEFLFTVTVFGDIAVGKTSLIETMIRISKGDRNSKVENHASTIGVRFRNLDFKMTDGSTVTWQIRDLAGEDKAETLQPMVFDANAYIFVYDLTRRATYESLDVWLKHRHRNCKTVVIVGNKCDKATEQRKVTRDEVIAKCDKEGYSFFETSAHTQEHVEGMMIDVSRFLISRSAKEVECDKKTIKLDTTQTVPLSQTQKQCAC